MLLGKKRRRFVEKVFKNELVAEDVQNRLAAAFANDERLHRIEWFKPLLRPKNRALFTPYGVLEARLNSGYEVYRDDRPLIHDRCTYPSYAAAFTDLDAAKAAALVHLKDDWGGGSTPLQTSDDGLWWSLPEASHAPEYDYAYSDLDDSYEFGTERLRELTRSFGSPAARDIIESCEAELVGCRAAVGIVQLPVWENPARGWFELKTPCGWLVIRRLVGWSIERDGAPMTYMTWNGEPKVIFDKLEHAKIHALRHAAENGLFRCVGDGTYWKEPTTHSSARSGAGG